MREPGPGATLGLLVLVAFAFIIAGCCGSTDAGILNDAAKLKVGFVYVGSPDDAGFTYAHDKGREALQNAFPDIEIETMENVADADAERVITELVEKGNRVIFSTSFGFMEPTVRVAEKYPGVIFLHCAGYMTAQNVGAYFGRMYQARYLSGLVAGMATETGKVGYVAAYPIPEVIRGINAFALGVQKANPDAVVQVVWTNIWYDPAAERRAANVLIDQGADVIAQHQDTPGPIQAARERGVWGVGYNSDMGLLAPETVLTSTVWDWGRYYIDTIQAVKDGTWTPDEYWGAMSDGVVGLAPYGPMVSEETKALVEKERARITRGGWDVFHGPLYNQAGELMFAAGEAMSDGEMLDMKWFVRGVEGRID